MSLLDPVSTTVRFSPQMKVGEINREVSWIITHKQHRELPNLEVLLDHKSVSVRRKVAQAYRELGQKSDRELLTRWLSKEADRQTYVAIEAALDAIERRERGGVEFDAKTLTVAEVLSQIKVVLGEKNYALEAEVVEVKNYYQLYYFTIKDPDSQTTLNCRCYQTVVFRAGFPLNEGLQIRLRGKFVLDKYSRLLFEVKSLQLTGEGELLRNLEILTQKLRAEGLLDPNRKRVLPKYPQKILLLASSNSAALTDFTQVLEKRRGGAIIYHLPIKTQGVGAETEVLRQLARANVLTDLYAIETIVLTRGGGSKEDLVVFNREAVVRAVHALNRPSIVAIGHERDTSLCELAADVRAATPSQAAELVSLSRQAIHNQTRVLVGAIERRMLERVYAYRQVTHRLQRVVYEIFRARIDFARLAIRRTDQVITQLLRSIYLQTAALARACSGAVRSRIITTNQTLTWVPYAKLAVSQRVKTFAESARHTVAIIRSLHPQTTLARGFALVTIQNQPVTDPAALRSGQTLQITLAKGSFEALTK